MNERIGPRFTPPPDEAPSFTWFGRNALNPDLDIPADIEVVEAWTEDDWRAWEATQDTTETTASTDNSEEPTP